MQWIVRFFLPLPTKSKMSESWTSVGIEVVQTLVHQPICCFNFKTIAWNFFAALTRHRHKNGSSLLSYFNYFFPFLSSAARFRKPHSYYECVAVKIFFVTYFGMGHQHVLPNYFGLSWFTTVRERKSLFVQFFSEPELQSVLKVELAERKKTKKMLNPGFVVAFPRTNLQLWENQLLFGAEAPKTVRLRHKFRLQNRDEEAIGSRGRYKEKNHSIYAFD